MSGGNYVIDKLCVYPYQLQSAAADNYLLLMQLKSLSLGIVWGAVIGQYTGAAEYIGVGPPGWTVDFADGLSLPEADTIEFVTTAVQNCLSVNYYINLYGQNLYI